MEQKKNILVISGSTRKRSINSNLIQVISNLYASKAIFTMYTRLSELPHFNVDLDTATPPPTVLDLREQLKAGDGVLICTPEYAMGLPGSLKNLLDWTVSSCEFSGKPVAVITASTSGEKAHESLLGTLRIIEAKVEDATALNISHAKSKITDAPEIKDAATLYAVSELMHAFLKML